MAQAQNAKLQFFGSDVRFSVAELASAIARSCIDEAESNFRDRLQRLHMALAFLDV
jgi:hypothetical protein